MTPAPSNFRIQMAPQGTDKAEHASACNERQLVRGPSSDRSKVGGAGGGGVPGSPVTCEALKIHFPDGGH